MKQFGKAMVQQLIEILNKADSSHVVKLTKNEAHVIALVLDGYIELLNRLDGDYSGGER